jgi:tetratricopeptide (TPR) repeat protein
MQTMHRMKIIPLAAALLAACIACASRASAPAGDSSTPSLAIAPPDLSDIWNDPAFVKGFLGGYGISPDVEPRISQDDMAIMELVRQLMPINVPATEALLRDSVRPESSAVLDLTLGGTLYQQGKAEEALAAYRSAVAKFPSFRRAYRSIGSICYSRNEYEDAIAAFNKMIELGSADADSYGRLGACHTARKDYQPAEAAFRNALLLQPEEVKWRLGLVYAVRAQGKFEDVISLVKGLLAKFPDNYAFWLLQASAYVELKQPVEASVSLEAVDAIGKSTPDSLYMLGDLYISQNLPAMALSAYMRAVEKDPTQPAARAIRASEMLAFRGGLPQSKDLLALVKKTWGDSLADADRRKLLKLQARVAMSGGSGNEETAAVLEEVIQIDPLDGEALMLLGQHYKTAAQPDKAILFYERAARIESFAANAKVKIAQVYVGQSRFDEALALLRDAQSIKPREDVARLIEQVERAAKGKR